MHQRATWPKVVGPSCAAGDPSEVVGDKIGELGLEPPVGWVSAKAKGVD